MSEQSVTLVLAGRGSLTIPGGGRFRTVKGGEPFTVDAATAAILLATDPSVSAVAAETPTQPASPAVTTRVVSADPVDRPLTELKVPQLVEIATALGLNPGKRAAKATLVEAITAERDRLAAAQAADATEDAGQDDEEPPTGDPQPETGSEPPAPEGPESGVLTLADLPAGALVGSDPTPA